MTQINPLAGALSQTSTAQRIVAAERDAQVRRSAKTQHSTGFTDQLPDEFVESADAIKALGEEDHHPDPRQQKRKKGDSDQTPDEEPPHIDIVG